MTPDELYAKIAGLPREDLMRFYAAYIHEITLIARDGYDPIDFEHLRRCNETLHRLSGHLNSLFGSANLESVDSFVKLCLNVADQRGWLMIVERALKTRVSD